MTYESHTNHIRFTADMRGEYVIWGYVFNANAKGKKRIEACGEAQIYLSFMIYEVRFLVGYLQKNANGSCIFEIFFVPL